MPAPADGAASVVGGSLIDEIVREGARRMLAAALEAEVAAYIAAHQEEVDGRGTYRRHLRPHPEQVSAAVVAAITAPVSAAVLLAAWPG